MEMSIVPKIINSQELEFLDEHNVKISICEETTSKFESPFKQPYIIIDSFMTGTKHPPKLKRIEIEELRKLGLTIMVFPISKQTKWFKGQRAIYKLENISSIFPGAKKLGHIPAEHRVVMDIANNLIRLEGKNAGFPHSNGHGPWRELKKEGEI